MNMKNVDKGTLEADRAEQLSDCNNFDIPDNVYVELNVEYGEINGRKLILNMFTPKSQPCQPRPAILFFHGGSWRTGNPGQFHFHAAHLASQYSFFAVNVDYRLSPEAILPAALHDAKCAVRWIRSKCDKFNIDSKRIAVCGGSSGAHIASMVLTTAGLPEYEGSGGHKGYNSNVNLGILFNGAFDMWDLVNQGSLLEPMRQFIGGTPEEKPELYTEFSSISRIHSDVPPVLFLHGAEDKCVSPEQSMAFYKKMISIGIHSEVEIYDGKQHGWFNNEPDRAITIKRMDSFLIDQFNL